MGEEVGPVDPRLEVPGIDAQRPVEQRHGVVRPAARPQEQGDDSELSRQRARVVQELGVIPLGGGPVPSRREKRKCVIPQRAATLPGSRASAQLQRGLGLLPLVRLHVGAPDRQVRQHEARVLLRRGLEQPPRLEVVLLGVEREQPAAPQVQLVGFEAFRRVARQLPPLVRREPEPQPGCDSRDQALLDEPELREGAVVALAPELGACRDIRPAPRRSRSDCRASRSCRRAPLRRSGRDQLREGRPPASMRNTEARAVTRSERTPDNRSIRFSVSPALRELGLCRRRCRPGMAARRATRSREA